MGRCSEAEHVEMGFWQSAGNVTAWAEAMLAVARARADRLERRGIRAPYLGDMETRAAELRAMAKDGMHDPLHGPEVQAAADVHDAAVGYWRRVKQMAKVEFGSDPDTLARFRTGVRVGPWFSHLRRELEKILPLLDEYREQLGWLGVDDAFVRRGWDHCRNLEEAHLHVRGLLDGLLPRERKWHRLKGCLYDLTRKLVRIGRLEFAGEPDASEFNYALLRQTRRKTARKRKPRSR